jgi:hypothetical protein
LCFCSLIGARRYLYECISTKLYVCTGEELNKCLMRSMSIRGMM